MINATSTAANRGRKRLLGRFMPILIACAVGTSGALLAQQGQLGYTDTPFLPGGKWRVHDGDRPQPRVVDPGTASTQETAGRPPSDAVVLFGGKDLSHWLDEKGGPAAWTVEDGAMVVKAGAGAIHTRDEFGDCQLHVEWAAPTPGQGTGQGRGNSGVFLFGRYEIQVLDSLGNKTYPDGQASAIYGQYPPLVNASRKPGEWQTYDILFTAPRFKDGQLERPAYATVLHNGVVVHNHAELLGPMAHRQLPKYAPHGPKGPISMQDHGNPVRFRNIWVRELKGYDEP
jgi:hypothetical protein